MEYIIIWSEFFNICCFISTDCTSQCVFISIFWMLNFEWTLLGTRALRKLIFSLSWYVITIDLSFMTRFTEMCISPTEPLRNWTAKSTLKFYIVLSMLLTILYSCTHTRCCTLTTHQFLRLILLSFLLCLDTVFHSTKISTLTFETLIISQSIFH
jgi:hypothetical protein